MKLKILAVVALGAVGVGAAVFAMGGLTANAANATEYLTSPATTGDVTDDVAATGSLAAQARYGLAFGADPFLVTETSTAPTSTTTWSVKEVKVAVGDTVAAGDVLVTAETTDLDRELAAAQNTLASARVSLRAARSTLADAEDADVTSQIRQAKIGLYGAENEVAKAKQEVADLQALIKAASLTAPVAGVVTELNVLAGSDAPADAAVVIDAAGFQVTTDVVESDLADVKVGQAATVTVSAVDAEIGGTVSAISPVASEDSGSGVVSYPVTVTLTEAPATLRSGMSADVTITIASATNVLTVPSGALQGKTGNYSVLTLGDDGTPVVTAVEVGLVTNALAEIKSGLAEGTAVVTGTASDLAGGTTNTGRFSGGVALPVGGGQFPDGGPDVKIEQAP